ncbi:unnamed protein product [Allacma fusca]|nr:unnamed protein product [Allacma fusca]
MEYCQTNPDHFHNNGNKSNNEMVQDVKQLQDSVQLLQQQFQQLSLNHQLLIGKHDAEISKLTLELQTLRDEMERGRRKIKKLRAKLASRETIPMSLHFQETVQAEPLMMSKSSGSGSKLKKTSGKVPDEPTQCPVCEKIFKLKRNYIKHQNQTKHGLLEDNSNSVLLSATRDNINQSDVSQVHLASGETVFTGVNHVQTPSKSDEKVNPQVEVIDPCHPLNGFTPIIVNETTNSNTPDSSCRNIYPNKRKPEKKFLSLLPVFVRRRGFTH